jgi:hypothetical protein
MNDKMQTAQVLEFARLMQTEYRPEIERLNAQTGLDEPGLCVDTLEPILQRVFEAGVALSTAWQEGMERYRIALSRISYYVNNKFERVHIIRACDEALGHPSIPESSKARLGLPCADPTDQARADGGHNAPDPDIGGNSHMLACAIVDSVIVAFSKYERCPEPARLALTEAIEAGIDQHDQFIRAQLATQKTEGSREEDALLELVEDLHRAIDDIYVAMNPASGRRGMLGVSFAGGKASVEDYIEANIKTCADLRAQLAERAREHEALEKIRGWRPGITYGGKVFDPQEIASEALKGEDA